MGPVPPHVRNVGSPYIGFTLRLDDDWSEDAGEVSPRGSVRRSVSLRRSRWSPAAGGASSARRPRSRTNMSAARSSESVAPSTAAGPGAMSRSSNVSGSNRGRQRRRGVPDDAVDGQPMGLAVPAGLDRAVAQEPEGVVGLGLEVGRVEVQARLVAVGPAGGRADRHAVAALVAEVGQDGDLEPLVGPEGVPLACPAGLPPRTCSVGQRRPDRRRVGTSSGPGSGRRRRTGCRSCRSRGSGSPRPWPPRRCSPSTVSSNPPRSSSAELLIGTRYARRARRTTMAARSTGAGAGAGAGSGPVSAVRRDDRRPRRPCRRRPP